MLEILKSNKVKELEATIESLRSDKKSLQETVDLQMETVEEQLNTIHVLQAELRQFKRKPPVPVIKEDNTRVI